MDEEMAAARKTRWTPGVMVVDVLLVNAATILTFLLRFISHFLKYGTLPMNNFVAYVTLWPWISVCTVILMQIYSLYNAHRKKWPEVFLSLILVVFWLTVVSMALSFLLRGFAFPRSVFLIGFAVQLLFLTGWRRLLWRHERRVFRVRRLMVVGPAGEAHALANKLIEANLAFDDVALVVDGEENPELCGGADPGRTVGGYERFPLAVDAVGPEEVYICSGVPSEEKISFVNYLVSRGYPVFIVPDVYEIFISRGRLEQVGDTPVFALNSPLTIPEEWRWLKRLIDILFSSVLLAVLSPLMLAIGLGVRLGSPGPAIYRQQRITERGREFCVYKFRTMVEGAEKTSGPVLASRNDPRLTRFGSFLRFTRLDEWPQLYNVLKGDMSLVGPRPERPFFVRRFVQETPEYAYRLQVKSGITGLAQVSGRYSTDSNDKLKYDLLYVRGYSPLRDLVILLQTVKVIFMRDKAS
ncbi:MAG: sugar transferase [Peptococcaceae bacterium]|nr:sugar transferase [Peptococcaceae bacterium]